VDNEQPIDTDGGAFVAGNVKTGGGAFTGRDVNEGDRQEVSQRFASNVTIYAAPTADREQTLRESLMPSVEAELRSEIKELTRAVIRLESSVDKNNTITMQQVEAIRAQSIALEKKFEERMASISAVVPAKPFPSWIGYAGLVLLTAIAMLLFWGMIFLTRGGN
jgi:hypothetical protein